MQTRFGTNFDYFRPKFYTKDKKSRHIRNTSFLMCIHSALIYMRPINVGVNHPKGLEASEV